MTAALGSQSPLDAEFWIARRRPRRASTERNADAESLAASLSDLTTSDATERLDLEWHAAEQAAVAELTAAAEELTTRAE